LIEDESFFYVCLSPRAPSYNYQRRHDGAAGYSTWKKVPKKVSGWIFSLKAKSYTHWLCSGLYKTEEEASRNQTGMHVYDYTKPKFVEFEEE